MLMFDVIKLYNKYPSVVATECRFDELAICNT